MKWIVQFFSDSKYPLGVLGLLYVFEQMSNGVLGTHFDLPELRQFILMVAGLMATIHGINSKWNSPDGMSPRKEI